MFGRKKRKEDLCFYLQKYFPKCDVFQDNLFENEFVVDDLYGETAIRIRYYPDGQSTISYLLTEYATMSEFWPITKRHAVKLLAKDAIRDYERSLNA